MQYEVILHSEWSKPRPVGESRPLSVSGSGVVGTVTLGGRRVMVSGHTQGGRMVTHSSCTEGGRLVTLCGRTEGGRMVTPSVRRVTLCGRGVARMASAWRATFTHTLPTLYPHLTHRVPLCHTPLLYWSL